MTSKNDKPTMSAKDIIDYRKKLKFTQEDLGQLLGVSRQAVNFWEIGERRVPETTVRLIKLFEKFPQLKREF